MDAPARVVHPLVALALVMLAVVGYIAGSHRVSTASSESPPSATRSISAAGLLVEYPAGWERATSAKAIPGLALEDSVTLLAHGAAGSGLVLGQLPPGAPAPLPASFLARLGVTPHVEVVDLVSTQAFRYSGARPSGFAGSLDVYAIPAAGGGERVMACYGAQPLSAASQQCERIVAGVAPTGPPSVTLTPEPTYARAVAAVLDPLQAERVRARRTMSTSAAPAALAAAAASLSSQLTSAAASLAALQAPPLAAAAAGALDSSLRAAGDAYAALAEAARAESLASYEAARVAVSHAETEVDGALESFTLLGYGT